MRQKRILVIRQDRIGDTVCATPLIRGLRQAFPDAYIAALVRPSVKPVLEGNPHLDAILTDDSEGADAGRNGFWKKLREVRTHRFNTALMLLPSERYTWMLFLAGIRKRVGVGVRPYHIMTCTTRVSRHKYIPLRHEADYCLDLGRAIGMQHDDLTEEVFLTDEERTDARSMLSELGIDFGAPLVSVHPVSGGSAPNWEPARYAALVRALLDEDKTLQVTVHLMQKDAHIRDAFSDIQSARLVFPDNRNNLRRMMALIAASDVEVSSSTGPMHLAAGLRIPTVSLFCPLTACSPILWGPKGNRATILLQPEDVCERECGNDPKKCTLNDISVQQAVKAVLEMVQTP